MWPSWIAITINDLIFVNVSTDYLLASRMGFPFPRKLEDVKGVTRASDFDAFFRVKTPLPPPRIPIRPLLLHIRPSSSLRRQSRKTMMRIKTKTMRTATKHFGRTRMFGSC